MAIESAPSGARLAFLDWTRGLAALIMLQGHVFHSFTATALRNDGPYVLSQFVGGMTPAIFLFLTGVTLAFLFESSIRRDLPPWERVWKGLGRARHLLILALLFRLQLWLFAWPWSPPSDLLKVDILNCMALAILSFAWMSLVRSEARIRYAALAGVAIAALSPVASMTDWSGLPQIVQSYFVPNSNEFSFFPWASFVAFGVAGGTILRNTREDALPRLMQWTCMGGIVLVMGAQYFSDIPFSIYPKSEFWLNSPGLIFIKLGVILLMMSFAYLWCSTRPPGSWSLLRQLGTTSLLVYWVHIELVYGRWFGGWKETLSVPQTIAASIVLTGAMVLLSLAQTQIPWRNLWQSFQNSGWGFSRVRSSFGD